MEDLTTYLNLVHDDLVQITRNITGNHEHTDDLYQHCILQILEKQPDIPIEQFKYYFIRVVKNNWYSKTSRFEYEFRRKITERNTVEEPDFERILGAEEETEQPQPTTEWVKKQLEDGEEDFTWYERDLFLLYLDLGNMTEMSKKTTIPLGTIGRQIRIIKKKLNNRWTQYYSSL